MSLAEHDPALDDPEHDELDAPAAGEEPGSILDAIRQEYESVSLDETEIFDVAPSEHFAVRYRYVAPEEFERSGKDLAKIKNTLIRNLYAACDSLIKSCDEILVYTGKDGETGPFLDDGEPLGFDDRLADALGWNDDRSKRLTPRQIVLRVFKGNEQALLDHAMEVSAWMKTVGSKVKEKTAGG